MNNSTNFFPVVSEEAMVTKRIIGSESDLLVALIRNNNAALYKIVRCFGFNHEDTEGMLQEIYIKAYAQPPNFEYDIICETFIIKKLVHKCVYNSSISYFQQKLKDVVYLNAGEQINSSSNDTRYSESNYVEYYRALEMNLYQLPISYRTVYILKEVGGYTLKEIAAIINTTTTIVIHRLNMAKAIINDELTNYTSSPRALGYHVLYTDQIVQKTLCKIP